MSSRNDETLPLSGFSDDFSVDVTVDEDFIPTSQPQSSQSSKINKSVESNSVESSEESNTQILSGFIDDTLPPEALIQETQDKSVDFIPDTETKKRKTDYFIQAACRKKLPVFGTEEIFDSQWKKPKMSENSTLDLHTDTIFCDSPEKKMSPNLKIGEGSATEILVNDSAETVELGDTPLSVGTLAEVQKSKACESFSPERYEETQIFDNSVLVLDEPGPSGLNRVKPKEMYLNESVDELQLDSKKNLEVSDYQGQVAEAEKHNENALLKEELLSNGVSQDPDSDSPSVIVHRIIDFKLAVSCLITINSITKKVVRKGVLNVNEKLKPRTPSIHNEPPTDCSSDKSKRCSTSSSGSVYSDKNGLPFALPKRVSAVSDQISASDSSEENIAKILITERKNRKRVPWNDEYLLALKMDEIVQHMIDTQDLINRPLIKSPRKPKTTHRNVLNHLEDISENSSGQEIKSGTDKSHSEKIIESRNSETINDNVPTSPLEEVSPEERTVEENVHIESHGVPENVEPDQQRQINPEPGESVEGEDVQFCEGLKVFARWTDKQYYSGVLSEQMKNEKWDVLFDDGTLKAIKEDFVLPVAWIKTGALVFALVDDNYESGQVIDVKRGEKPTYVVRLDNGKQDLTVELSDMCLSEDMASILKENYRPVIVESPQRRADINCDNVVTGKRVREFRTPLRPQSTRVEGSGSKKKPSSKTKDLETIKDTPKKRKSDRNGALKSENGHLVEDNTLSADSPSGNETGETPLRSAAKEARGKAKPRSLTYEPEEKQKKRKQKNWLANDGTPIPGPSGVKLRKKKADEPSIAEQAECSLENTEPEIPVHEEKNKRKRKAAETGKEESPKKSETETRITRGRRK